MEEIKLTAKLLLIVVLCILANVCMFSIASEDKINRKLVDKQSIKNDKTYKYMYYPLSNKKAFISLKILFLLIAAYFLFGEIIQWHNLFNSTDYIDFNAFYVASKTVLQGKNPYNLKEYMDFFHFPFLYLPNILPLIAPLSFFEHDTSARIFFLFNLMSMFFLIAGALNLLSNKSLSYQITLVISCLLIFGLTWGLRMGQLTVILACVLIWAVVFAKQNKNRAAGILLGIATIKPTIVILFFFYFLLKKRFVLIGWCLLTSIALTLIGILMIHNYITDFLQLYKTGYDLAFTISWNTPYNSPTRIDVEVIAARIFGNSWLLTKVTSSILQLLPIALAFTCFYKQQVKDNWNGHIYLSDISLLACLSVYSFYSQSYSTSMLVLVIPFLLNYLYSEIINRHISLNKILAWCLSIFCLLLLSHISYFLFNYIYLSFKEKSQFIQLTVALIPNYALLGLTASLYLISDKRERITIPPTNHGISL